MAASSDSDESSDEDDEQLYMAFDSGDEEQDILTKIQNQVQQIDCKESATTKSTSKAAVGQKRKNKQPLIQDITDVKM